MTDIVRPGAALVFMKVGTHAREPLPEIIARKRQEIEDAGHALWGYGGNTCHPLTSVQPFAREFVQHDGVIYLVMQPMQSKHFAIPDRAQEFSAFPHAIEAGSRPVGQLAPESPCAPARRSEGAYARRRGPNVHRVPGLPYHPARRPHPRRRPVRQRP